MLRLHGSDAVPRNCGECRSGSVMGWKPAEHCTPRCVYEKGDGTPELRWLEYESARTFDGMSGAYTFSEQRLTYLYGAGDDSSVQERHDRLIELQLIADTLNRLREQRREIQRQMGDNGAG